MKHQITLKVFIVIIVLQPGWTIQAFGQTIVPSSYDYARYIKEYREIAVQEMKRCGIPASIILAQGIIESNCGKSKLAIEANNHFGLKCHDGWNGPTYKMDDDAKDECFRKYDYSEDSYRDHSEFLRTGKRYTFLFSLNANDYDGWARGLKKAGYATNPQYPQILIRIIEENKLYLLDDANVHPEIAEYEIDQETPKHFKNNEWRFSASDFKEIKKSPRGRPVYENNGIPFVIADKGDSFNSLSSEFKIYAFQVRKNNDMDKKHNLKPGQIVYLEAKKRKGISTFYKVHDNETLWMVSQVNGLRLKKLLKYNHLHMDDIIRPGQILKLRR